MKGKYVNVYYCHSIEYDDGFVSLQFCIHNNEIYTYLYTINSYRLYRNKSIIILYNTKEERAYLCPIKWYFIFTIAIIYPMINWINSLPENGVWFSL